jgi:Fe-S cluster biogenesis protein NfuA
MKDQLNKLLTEEVNPILKQHMGGCELLTLNDGVAQIKLTGSCSHCPGKKFTFNEHIVPYLLNNVEGLKEIILK